MPPMLQKSLIQIRRSCSIKGCEDQRHLPNHVFFSFPEDASLCNIWKEMTGRTNWSPNDVSYICRSHFTSDCFSVVNGKLTLAHGSVPTLKLPKDVMEVEYIDEDMLESDPQYETVASNSDISATNSDVQRCKITKTTANLELLKLFHEVQIKQRQVVSQSKRLQHEKRMLRLRNRLIHNLNEKIKKNELKRKEALHQQEQRKPIDQSMDDRDESKEVDTEEAEVLLMPTRYTRDSKNFALSVYNYSPEAYIYLRNTLRTVLPSTGMLKKWLSEGFQAKNVMTDADCLKVVTEVREQDLYCRVSVL